MQSAATTRDDPETTTADALFGAGALSAPGEERGSIEDVLRAVLSPPSRARRNKLLAMTLLCAACVVIAGFIVWGWGYRTQRSNPGFWQVSLCSMLFWLSVSQGMVAMSALLRLCHASWRYPLSRMLDMASLFGVWAIALIPFLVAARGAIYKLGSVSFASNVWRVAGSTFWDSFTIGTAFVAGWMLLYLTCLPDFATLAAMAPEGSHKSRLFRRLAWFWRGDALQWRALRNAEGVLVVGVIASFVGSQTVLGWDFQLASARDWDSSIFAPLYTLGSLLAGTAMTVLVATAADRLVRGHSILQERHYDNLGRVMMGLGLIWFYFRWCDFLTAWYERIPHEWRIEGNQFKGFPWLAATMVIGCFVVPVFAEMPSVLRKSRAVQCVVAVCVLTGVAVQRYLDTVPTFAPHYPVSALIPTVGSSFVFVGLAGMFVLTYLIAARYIPVVSHWAHAKQQTRSKLRTLGNGSVTVMLADPPVWET